MTREGDGAMGPYPWAVARVTKEHERYRQQVRLLLADEPVRAVLHQLRTGAEREPDVRPFYRELGRRGLLAPNWPAEYGGEGRSLVEAAIAAEEITRFGVPDTVFVNTVQIIGLFILMEGTAAQKARHLPVLARGERFGSVLYTEPGCGSDLGSLTTTARRDGDGWRINGVKTFSIKSHLTDIGLCAARTGAVDSRYEGITLFLIDLHASGVRRTSVPAISDEQFHRLQLDEVWVDDSDRLGPVHGGWPLITRSLVVERTGLDYSLKAENWLAAAVAVLSATGTADDRMLEDIGRFAGGVSAGRLLTYQVLAGLTEDRLDEAKAAMAKLYNSELAQAIARWSSLWLPSGETEVPVYEAATLESAYREAPGVTIAGGTSEMMNQIIASLALDNLEQEAPW